MVRLATGPSEALAMRQGGLEFLEEGWDQYARKVEYDLATVGQPRVEDPVGSFARFRLATKSALIHGPTYWWSPDMSRSLKALAGSVPDKPLEESDLLAPAGFFYYAEPIPLGTSDKYIVATGWIFTAEDEEEARFEWTASTGVTGACIIHFSRRPGGRHIIPVTMSPWAFGNTMQTHVDNVDLVGGHSTEESLRRGLYSGMDLLRLFVAGQALLHQKAIALRREDPDYRVRDDVSRAPRGLRTLEDKINVIYLREREPSGVASDGVPRSVDWNCRWWVGLDTLGHWRLQPTKEGPKRILIPPFVKGPAGKPLKVAPTVRAVTR